MIAIEGVVTAGYNKPVITSATNEGVVIKAFTGKRLRRTASCQPAITDQRVITGIPEERIGTAVTENPVLIIAAINRVIAAIDRVVTIAEQRIVSSKPPQLVAEGIAGDQITECATNQAFDIDEIINTIGTTGRPATGIIGQRDCNGTCRILVRSEITPV